MINLYRTWTYLPEEDMIPQLTYICRKILAFDRTDPLRRRLLDFHTKYFIKFWVEKVRPHRLTLFRIARRTTNELERLHRRMKHTLGKRPQPFLFIAALKRNIFDRDEAHYRTMNETSFPRPRARAYVEKQS